MALVRCGVLVCVRSRMFVVDREIVQEPWHCELLGLSCVRMSSVRNPSKDVGH